MQHLDGVLPPGYRLRLKWIWWPLEIAGRTYWLDTIPVIQRYEGWYNENGEPGGAAYNFYWHDVGFWDEVYPQIAKKSLAFPEL